MSNDLGMPLQRCLPVNPTRDYLCVAVKSAFSRSEGAKIISRSILLKNPFSFNLSFPNGKFNEICRHMSQAKICSCVCVFVCVHTFFFVSVFLFFFPSLLLLQCLCAQFKCISNKQQTWTLLKHSWSTAEIIGVFAKVTCFSFFK